MLILGIQIGALTSLLQFGWGPLLAGILVCVSRWTVLITCQRAVPGARSDGLGSTYASAISPSVGVAGWLLLTTVTTVGFLLIDESWWRGPVCTAAAIVTVALLVRRAVRRLGGVTGDVYGASIEVALAMLLLTAT